MAYDMNVAQTAYQTAASMGADAKVMLALFEAGIVESGFQNLLQATDHDSVGFLQQRPSQGWPDPTNVATATHSFVTKAIRNEGQYSTAGQLAQSVQISAYPDRYDQHQSDAQALLQQVAGGAGNLIAAGVSGAANDFSSLLGSFVKPVTDIASSVTTEAKLATTLSHAFLPTNAIRIAAGLFGTIFVLIGIFLLGREVRHG